MDRKYIQVEGAPALFRDTQTSAIINTDTSGYESYIRIREAAKQKLDDAEKQSKEIENIKEELNSIKKLLLELVSKQ